MSNIYYKYPLALSRFFEGRNLSKCDIGESISQNIQLLITSSNGEHRYNTTYGCKVWEMDFELVMSQSIWEEKLRQSLIIAITENEKRIERAEIGIRISEVEKRISENKYLAVKRKVDIHIKAIVCETGENYHFHTDLFLSPISQY